MKLLVAPTGILYVSVVCALIIVIAMRLSLNDEVPATTSQESMEAKIERVLGEY